MLRTLTRSYLNGKRVLQVGEHAIKGTGFHGLHQVEVHPDILGAAAVFVLSPSGDGDQEHRRAPLRLADALRDLVAIELQAP